MKRAVILVLCAGVLLSGTENSGLQAQEKTPPSEPELCNQDTAETVNFHAITQTPEAYRNKCVRVQGLRDWFRLYADQDGIYLTERHHIDVLFGDLQDDETASIRNPHRMGLYFSEGSGLSMEDGTNPAHFSGVGQVYLCDDLHDAEDDESDGETFTMVAGYCHYHYGPYLWVTEGALKPTKTQRLTGDDNRQRVGNLVNVPEDWPHKADAQKTLDAWVNAIETGDKQGFIRLSRMRIRKATAPDREDQVEYPGSKSAEALEWIFDDEGSPYADLRRPINRRPTVLFLYRNLRLDPRTERKEEVYFAFGCACRNEDCAGQWPISTLDIKPDNALPYVCMEMEKTLRFAVEESTGERTITEHRSIYTY